MDERLRVLLVEDSEDDAVLLVRKLKADGLDPDWIRVEEAEVLRKTLREKAWDIVLADHALPRFSGTAALAVVKETGLDIPVILVSGTIGEEMAIEAMKAGAVDYIMKDKLGRLGPSIRREVAEARIRADKRKADEELRESARRWKATFDAIDPMQQSALRLSGKAGSGGHRGKMSPPGPRRRGLLGSLPFPKDAAVETPRGSRAL
jgi:DNA-binding NtrC family response regulator